MAPFHENDTYKLPKRVRSAGELTPFRRACGKDADLSMVHLSTAQAPLLSRASTEHPTRTTPEA